MKNLSVIIVLSLILVVGCNPTGCKVSDNTVVIPKSEYDSLKSVRSEYPKELPKPPIDEYSKGFRTFKIIVVDSCEYILGYTHSYNGGPVLTHKGNCKFCAERQRKLLNSYLTQKTALHK